MWLWRRPQIKNYSIERTIYSYIRVGNVIRLYRLWLMHSTDSAEDRTSHHNCLLFMFCQRLSKTYQLMWDHHKEPLPPLPSLPSLPTQFKPSFLRSVMDLVNIFAESNAILYEFGLHCGTAYEHNIIYKAYKGRQALRPTQWDRNSILNTP